MAITYYYTPNSSTSTEGDITVTDMIGRPVTIPSDVQKVITTSPPMTILVYMLAPDKLAGLNFQWTDSEKKYVDGKYQNLPVVGGWFGSEDGNYEEIMTINPDMIIEGGMGNINLEMVNNRQEKFGTIPVIGVTDNSDLTKITHSIEFMGKILKEEGKANTLIDFTNKYLDKANDVSNSIPNNEKKKVYYAYGIAGLQTDPKDSLHAQLIDIVGGENVADIPLKGEVGHVDVSMEQVISWNPELIIADEESFYENVYNNPKWKNIKAVKEKQVYLYPQSPFKWFDRPPSANTIIGILWTAKVIYPDKYSDVNLKEEVKYFYKEFYHFNLSDSDVKEILEKSGLKEENM